MAKAPKQMQAALTGTALLAAIAASETGYLMLTQAEATEGMNAGHLELKPGVAAEGDKAAVTLTDAGFAAFQASEHGDNARAGSADSAPASSASSASSGYEIETGIAIPTGTASRRGRQSGYPFDKLEVGQSFHVAKSADNTDPAARLASSVSGANAKYAEPTGEKKSVTVKNYAKGEDGKFLKDAEGKRIVESETTEERDVTRFTRTFVVKAVGAEDPKGEGARVWRTA
jgi:hypothetical protein